MKKASDGNGSGQTVVNSREMGGWVRVTLAPKSPMPEDLPLYLAHRLSQWLRGKPHLRLLSVLPIVKDGDTGELQAWYEQHIFTDVSPLADTGRPS